MASKQARDKRFDLDAFVRECQECDHKQVDKDPCGHPTTAFRNRKCRKCGSESLDYGSYNYYWEE